MKNLLITGATGFIGKELSLKLLQKNYKLTASIRKPSSTLPSQINKFIINDSFASLDWTPALKSINTVIHTAARVHVMHDKSTNPLAEFRKINVDATLNLAQQAASSGVSRFIFISSIKANGESTNSHHIFTPDNTTIPTDPYGLSKYEAEQGLLALAKKTKMEIVIIRPPLVYGLNVKGNFLSLIKCVQKRIPLPLGSIYNRRSFVALDNLVDFIICCINHPKAANEIFIISDNEDISTTELLHRLATAFNTKSLLVPIPSTILLFFAKLLSKKEALDRLLGSLQVDSSKARELLSWKPVTSMDNQLKKIANSYLIE